MLNPSLNPLERRHMFSQTAGDHDDADELGAAAVVTVFKNP